MKKILISIATMAAVVTSANAGKNYVPPKSEPIPVPPPAIAIPLGIYLGGGFTYSSADCVCLPIDLAEKKLRNLRMTAPTHSSDTQGVNLKAGYEFNEYIGIEAKYFYTPWGDEDRTIKHYGLYLKPNYPVTEHLDIYALLGYGKTECDTLKDSETGFGWGAGASYNFGKRVNGKRKGLGVYVEYLRPLKKTGNKDITIDTVNAGLQYNF